MKCRAVPRSAPEASTGASRQRGVAFILVIAVLAALMVLAVPLLTVARHDNAGSHRQEKRAECKDGRCV